MVKRSLSIDSKLQKPEDSIPRSCACYANGVVAKDLQSRHRRDGCALGGAVLWSPPTFATSELLLGILPFVLKLMIT
jgi:hypothetical protein